MTSNRLGKTAFGAVIIAVLFIVGSQFYAQQTKLDSENQAASFAERVISLCKGGDPKTMQDLIEAGICENAHQIQVKGETGDQGAQGITGRNGKDGADGKDGTDGESVTGSPGADGQPGLDGKPGADGQDGLPGKDGKDGAPGKDGLPGKDGADGLNGADGRTPTQMDCVRVDPLGDEYTCSVTGYQEQP